jgi:hypothetical protein
MNLFSDPTFSFYATPAPSQIQKVFELVRKGDYPSAKAELSALTSRLEKVAEFINDEAQ